MSSPSSDPNVSSLQFQDLFDAALREYCKKTGKDIATDPLTVRFFDCKSSDAVLDILEEQVRAFEQFREGDWKVQLLKRLKPTVEILYTFSTSDVVVEGIGLIFPPANAIFAGVGFLLAAAKGVSNSYDALMELFECFEHFLGRFKVLTEIPDAMREILVKILVELLKVLALATQQINQGRFKKFVKTLVRDNDIGAVLQRLDQLTKEELRMTATQTMEIVCCLLRNMKVVMDDGKTSINGIQGALVTMQEMSVDFNKMKRNKLRKNIQKWLSPPDASINHNIQCESHQNGTATWFLKGHIYSEWKAKGVLLWTHGNPGSGKSVLCSSIIKDIEAICVTGLASLAYYYFDFKDTEKQNRRGLLSSLLIQLCTQSHHGYDILSQLYESHQDGLRQPSDVDLIQCLMNILALPGHGRVYIIVDAMDESPNKPGIPSPREKVLQLMKELVDLRCSDIRVCVTSRPEVDIRMAFEPLASHTVSLHDEGGQQRDIINYIESVVRSDADMKKWRPEDRQLVIDSLSRNANGMFRWVVCQLDALRRCFPASIQHALDELPMNLDETYERILLGIDKEKREHAIRLFKCLGFSRRPLRVNELAEVLAVQFRTAIPNLNIRLRPGDADKAVLSACSTLVTTVKLDDDDESDDPDNCNSRVVQFSHYSVKEFLTSERLAKSERAGLSQYHIAPVPSHTVLAQSCICTLLHSDLQIGDITDGFPLAKYAAQNWFHHAQLDGVASQIQYGMEDLFDPAKAHFAVWISIHNIDHVPSRSQLSGPPNPPEPSPLYYATLSGISSLVEFLIITRQQDPNKSHGGWGTPLHAAAVLGHTAIARILLKHNADVNARDKHNSTPLHEASGSGNLDVMRLLLEHRVDVNVLDHQGGSPLYRAFQYQKFDAMKLLVEGGADVNVRNKSNSTVLHEASASGNLEVIRFLLSLGADANVLDRWGDSPLHKAFRYHDAMKLLVLEGGANVNVRNKLKSTLLHDTLRSGNHDVMRFLLSLGADVNTLDHQGFTLLHEASRYQKFDAVKLLVNEGADVNALDKSNSTPLHEASGSGNLDIARFLLSHGADVNALDHLGGSPLHKAIRYYDAVEFLVSRGADVNVRDKSGSTPLHEASGSGNLDVIELLLSRGANLDVLDHRRDSPLHRAFQYQKFDAMELLVNKGADANVRNKSNSTLLHEASASRNLDVAQLLLNHGADINALDRWGDAPLHKLFISLTSDVVEPQHKDHVTATLDTYNWTQIRKASGNVDLVPTLSKKCADAMNAWDNERSTPSHDASQGEKYAMAQLLLAHGADANARGWRHKTPLQLASLEGSLDVSQLLIEHGAVEAQNDEV